MITAQFNIKNPFSNKWTVIKSWAGSMPFKNKFWDAQFNRTSDIFGFEFRYTTKQSHAGLLVSISLIGFELMYNFYDNRHWDYIDNKWEE